MNGPWTRIHPLETWILSWYYLWNRSILVQNLLSHDYIRHTFLSEVNVLPGFCMVWTEHGHHNMLNIIPVTRPLHSQGSLESGTKTHAIHVCVATDQKETSCLCWLRVPKQQVYVLCTPEVCKPWCFLDNKKCFYFSSGMSDICLPSPRGYARY